ncbi:hypothetical protein ACP26L_36080 (plasmid) [Paenibacillus sp. S-38]|uniref:hypothetical protein n=1 Tax=Paenibacillus sp. S-38 TaxID=3416710 RepID=UPI003CEF0F02
MKKQWSSYLANGYWVIQLRVTTREQVYNISHLISELELKYVFDKGYVIRFHKEAMLHYMAKGILLEEGRP